MKLKVRRADVGHNLITHLRRIVGRRDRTSLNGALVLAARSLLDADRIALLRVVRHNDMAFVIPCASMQGESEEVHDAYLLSPQMGQPLATRADWADCCAQAQPQLHKDADGYCHLLPLHHHDQPYALLELHRAKRLSKREMALADQLLGLFIDHLTLIDYAETDTLTGLLNRKTFDENLSRILAAAGDDDSGRSQREHPRRRHAREGDNWLAVADVDHFKRVNDTHGHIIGDEVLLLVAQIMRRAFRFDDQLFRFGGEEFVTVLQPTSQADAGMVLERFRQSVEDYDFPIVGRVTISIGFTRVDPMDTPTELVGRADQALYFSKRNGRNRVENHEQLAEDGRIVGVQAHKPAAELF